MGVHLDNLSVESQIGREDILNNHKDMNLAKNREEDVGGFGKNSNAYTDGVHVHGGGFPGVNAQRGSEVEKTHADWTSNMDVNQPRSFCPGFTIADVAEKIRSESGGEGTTQRRASDSVTWKRRE